MLYQNYLNLNELKKYLSIFKKKIIDQNLITP